MKRAYIKINRKRGIFEVY